MTIEAQRLTRLDATVLIETAPPRSVFMVRFNMNVPTLTGAYAMNAGNGYVKVTRPDAIRIIGGLFDTHHEDVLGYRVPLSTFTRKMSFENRPRITYWIG